MPDHLVERKKLFPLDIIFEMAGGTATQSTGRSALIKRSLFQRLSDKPLLCASFCRHLRIDQKQYTPQFIYYLLQALYHAGYMAVFNTQHTGVSRFQYTSFKKMTSLDVPPPRIQRKIAAVLSAYDDLIENNNRRIAILEKMAEELYREWFVRLRFPGHEKVEIVKGVPEGWKIKHLGEIAELAYGKALKEEDRIEGNFPVIGSSGIVGCHNTALVKGPGIVVGRKGNVGRVIWSKKDFYPIDTVYYVRSKFPFDYLFYLIKSMNFINNDSAVPGLNRGQAYSNEFFLPEKRLIELFAATVKSLFQKKDIHDKQKERLTTARDRLLTRLMLGKIDVEDLDIQFPASMKEEEVARPVGNCATTRGTIALGA